MDLMWCAGFMCHFFQCFPVKGREEESRSRSAVPKEENVKLWKIKNAFSEQFCAWLTKIRPPKRLSVFNLRYSNRQLPLLLQSFQETHAFLCCGWCGRIPCQLLSLPPPACTERPSTPSLFSCAASLFHARPTTDRLQSTSHIPHSKTAQSRASRSPQAGASILQHFWDPRESGPCPWSVDVFETFSWCPWCSCAFVSASAVPFLSQHPEQKGLPISAKKNYSKCKKFDWTICRARLQGSTDWL